MWQRDSKNAHYYSHDQHEDFVVIQKDRALVDLSSTPEGPKLSCKILEKSIEFIFLTLKWK